MRKYAIAFVVGLAFISLTAAQQGFKLYPGAKLD